jgi:acetate---CoA ligase (ADP-forming)
MLDMFSNPSSIAVVGAAREKGKLGYGVLSNLIEHGFAGKIYPINPKADEILGLKCYPSIDAVPGEIETAVIVIPGAAVASAIEQCGVKGVKGAIVISAGFRETGAEGSKRERELVDIARRYGMRLVGPNCLGVIDTVGKMNASFAVGMPMRGKIAFMSQSGALCTSVLDVALAEHVGFSHFVSLGNKADLNELDFVDAWADDPDSRVIMAYLEGIVSGAKFMETARRVTKSKPIIAIKSGTTAAGSRAVSSHTGSLAGSEKAYEAAFNQAGIIRAGSMQDLFDYSVAFARQPLIANGNVAVLTNAGGPGIMATDALERSGLKLASLERATMDALREKLPSAASVLNPVDVLGDALADRYGMAMDLVLKDPNVSAVIVVLTPQMMTQIRETAHAVGETAARYNKTVLGCFMGEATTGPGVDILNEHGVPNYLVPERAVAALKAMMRYRTWLERPAQPIESFPLDKARVAKLFAQVREDGRTTIGDSEARDILDACGIRIPKSVLATTPDEAVAFAEKVGYPVVMKIASPDILHKTDIGGVKLGIRSASDVRDAFDLLVYRATRYMADARIWGCQVQEMVQGGREVIVGMNRDPQFGPLMMFGLGGIYVEALKDVSFRIAPVSRQETREMLGEIRSYNLLRGVRGERPSDIEGVVDVVLKLSQLVTEFPEIVEMDINPLIVFEEGKGTIAIDMRLVIK